MRTLAGLALGLALVACQHAPPAGDTPAESPATERPPAEAASDAARGEAPLRFRFGWQPGLRARLATTSTRTNEAMPGAPRSATSTIEVRVEANGDDLRVLLTEPKLDLPGDSAAVPAGVRSKLLSELSGLVPDYVVTREGEFKGIYDLPGFQARLRGFLKEIVPKDADPATAARVEQTLTSEQMLTASAAQQWNTLVGLWVGGEMAAGTEYTEDVREPVPILPGREILMHYTIKVKQRLPCERSGEMRECADVELHAVSDPADTAKAIEGLLAELGGVGRLERPEFHALDIETRIELRTEPQGLYPHECTVTKSVRGTIEVEGEQAKFGQLDRTEMQLEYP